MYINRNICGVNNFAFNSNYIIVLNQTSNLYSFSFSISISICIGFRKKNHKHFCCYGKFNIKLQIALARKKHRRIVCKLWLLVQILIFVDEKSFFFLISFNLHMHILMSTKLNFKTKPGKMLRKKVLPMNIKKRKKNYSLAWNFCNGNI